jgi:NAD(P)-dependent dehydrogenase (short-subunit alcohol dehydrogenase family)
MFNLTGKIALVAGGAGYLGQPICRKLAEQGATVIVADLNIERAKEVSPHAMFLDIGNKASIKNAVSQTVSEFGKLDILVNCTYYSIGKLVEDLSEEEFDKANHVNLTGSFLLAQEAGRVMQSGSSIIMFSSMYGQVAPDPAIYTDGMKPNPIEYGVGKAGLIQMVRYLAVHWGPRNIRVNAVSPGPFPNPQAQKERPDFIEKLSRKVPLGRIGQSEEIAGAVVFLASEEASFITGQTLAVNGGWDVW